MLTDEETRVAVTSLVLDQMYKSVGLPVISLQFPLLCKQMPIKQLLLNVCRQFLAISHLVSLFSLHSPFVSAEAEASLAVLQYL